jgi:hypothetical protein
VTQEASGRLLDGHGLGDFALDALESASCVKPKRSALDVSGTDDHTSEAEFAGRSLGCAQHVVSQAGPAPTGIDVHAPEFRCFSVMTFNAKRTHDPSALAA